jgi:hypothetical protein
MSLHRILFPRHWMALVAAVAVSVLAASPSWATPPNIPSESTARSELAALVVSSEDSMTGYSRDLFPTWAAISGNCNAREWVLQRDGAGVTVNGACEPTSGSWFSEYDGVTISASSGVDIDHVVPLAEAWRSGASSWTTSRRGDFANDVDDPQLIAVSASSNRSKGDDDPSTWTPTRASYRCTYSKIWIASKYAWGLELQSTEKTALLSLLDTC